MYCTRRGLWPPASSRRRPVASQAIRLVPTGGGIAPLSTGEGREGVEREARGVGRATAPSPGGSGRYRPALARVGGDSRAAGGR